MQDRHLWSRSPTSRGGGIIALLLLILAGATGLAWTTAGHNEQSTQAAPSFLETTLPGYEPWGLAHDRAGNIWVADPECDPNIYNHPVCPSTRQGNLIKYAGLSFHNGAQPVHIYGEPAGYSSPFFIAIDASNNIWFTEPVTNAIGELDRQGNWQQWSVPTPNASPFDLTIDAYGHLWFTEPGVSAIGEFLPGTRQFLSFPTPTPQGDPYGITGPDPLTGSIWFTENNNQVHRIGRLLPGSGGGISGRIQEYIAPATNNNTPHLITFDNRGNIWWSEGWSGKIGQLVIRQAVNNTSTGVREYSVPSPNCPSGSNCGVHISGIAAAPNGSIWFDDSLSSRIGSYTPGSGFSLYTLEGSVSSGSHPHDGLIVDANGNPWLSEEFGNRLVEIVENRPGPIPTPTPAHPTPTPTPTRMPGCNGYHER
jgi:virginiamycin B lyase